MPEPVDTLRKDIEKLTSQIESLRQEKERIHDQYRAKYDEVDNKTRSRQAELGRINDAFKEQFELRFKAMEEKENELRAREAVIDVRDGKSSEMERYLNELEESLNKSSAAKKAEIEELISKNNLILLDVINSKVRLGEESKTNEQIMLEIEARGHGIKLETGLLEAKRQALVDEANANDAKLDEIKEEALSLRNMIAQFQDMREDNSAIQLETDQKLDEANQVIGQAAQAQALLEEKRAEIQAMIDKSESIAEQNRIESEKNSIWRRSNIAKEINLNEKERAIQEREKAVMVIEKQLAEKGT